MTDQEIIARIANLCDHPFGFEIDGGRCVSISFHDESFPLGGLLRRSPRKHQILSLVSRLPHIKRLNLRKCKLGSVPEMASRDLVSVDLSCNDLEQVPDWVYRQQGLQELNLGANDLTRIGDLDHLPLKTLKVHKNRLKALPSLNDALLSLNLFINDMSSVPDGVYGLKNLEALTFGLSGIKSLEGISTLSRLRWLTVAVNEIVEVPDEICELRSLEGLQLPKNKISRLPQRFGELGIKSLTLYRNCLQSLPESFYSLKLNKLSLSSNPLLPAARGKVLANFSSIDLIKL